MQKKKSKESRTPTPEYIKNLKRRDVPATVGLVLDVRDELKADIRSLEHKMESRFESVESRLDSMESQLHRMSSMMEQQHSENRIVLDGIKMVMEKWEHESKRIDNLESTVRSLAKPKAPISQ